MEQDRGCAGCRRGVPCEPCKRPVPLLPYPPPPPLPPCPTSPVAQQHHVLGPRVHQDAHQPLATRVCEGQLPALRLYSSEQSGWADRQADRRAGRRALGRQAGLHACSKHKLCLELNAYRTSINMTSQESTVTLSWRLQPGYLPVACVSFAAAMLLDLGVPAEIRRSGRSITLFPSCFLPLVRRKGWTRAGGSRLVNKRAAGQLGQQPALPRCADRMLDEIGIGGTAHGSECCLTARHSS